MSALYRWSLLVLLAMLPVLSSADVVVSHFEQLNTINVSATTLRFVAMGEKFDVQLESNERVLAGLNAAKHAAEVGVYRGKLADRPDSWVRIVVHNSLPRGLIWDGNEMFVIEAPGDSDLSESSAVIYRLADSYIVPGTMSCGSDTLAGNAAVVWKNMGAAQKAAIANVSAFAPGAVSEITMSAIGDYEFTSSKGGDGAADAAIATRLNNVDGFFSEQVGVQINVQYVETNSDPGDYFGDTLSSDELLDELSEYRLQTAAHNAAGLTHLFTGRNLDTTTVGVAWLDSLCDNYFGAGLTEGRGSPLNDSLIAAHEIGHNFGADHDGEQGSSCAAETGSFIMSPSINGSDQFSACSIGVMQAAASAASCVIALPTVDVSIALQQPISNILLGAATAFEYRVSSNGLSDALSVNADFSLPSMLALNAVTTTSGSCTSGAGTVQCALGDLAGLSGSTITLSTTPIAVGVGTLGAAVSTSSSDERPANNQSPLLLTVDAAVDLAVGALATAPVFVDAGTSISASLSNLSIVDASDVTLSITLEAGLQANTASWSLGNCTVTAQQVSCLAGVFAAQSNTSLNLTATGKSAGRRDVTVTLTSAEADADLSNNTATAEVQVVAPKDDKDEGGGITNPLSLLLLMVAIAVRRRQAGV